MVGADAPDCGQVTTGPLIPQFQLVGVVVAELMVVPAGNVNVTTASGTLHGPMSVTTAWSAEELNEVIVMNTSAWGSD